MTSRNRKTVQRRKRPEPYRQQLARSAAGSAAGYLIETVILAVASVILSFFDLPNLVSLAILLLFANDISKISDHPPRKLKLVGRRLVEGTVTFGLSYLFQDQLGMLVSGLVILLLVLGLFDRVIEWLDKMGL